VAVGLASSGAGTAVDGICLMFRKGSPGENQYGPDPLEFGDYLVVDIHQLVSAK
jgi:hypothetical protein